MLPRLDNCAVLPLCYGGFGKREKKEFSSVETFMGNMHASLMGWPDCKGFRAIAIILINILTVGISVEWSADNL